MTLDPVSNFARVEVSTGYSDTDTSIVLASGEGDKLPDTQNYNLVWYNDTDYPDPSDDPSKEIIRVTGCTSDTLTITRAQESTGASVKNIAGKSYYMILAITKKMIDDIDSALTSGGTDIVQIQVFS